MNETATCPRCKREVTAEELIGFPACVLCMEDIERKRRQKERINSPRRFRNKTEESDVG